MPYRKRKRKDEFWVVIIVAGVIVYTLVTMWWKWIILGVLLVVLGFILKAVLKKVPSQRATFSSSQRAQIERQDDSNEQTTTEFLKAAEKRQSYLPQQKPKIEHEKAWEKADEDRTQWFVYILKLDDGKFYVGHTGELRPRLMEHRDDKVPSTKGQNGKLQYFETLTSRTDAELREANLKEIVISNPRQIRRMIIDFKDRIDELKYES